MTGIDQKVFSRAFKYYWDCENCQRIDGDMAEWSLWHFANTVRIANSWARIKPTALCSVIDKENSIESSYISCTLFIQLLYGLCTTFPWLLCDFIVWHVTCDSVMWHFPILLPCVVSPKEKEKKRNINNDLAVLPSHDKYCFAYVFDLYVLFHHWLLLLSDYLTPSFSSLFSKYKHICHRKWLLNSIMEV